MTDSTQEALRLSIDPRWREDQIRLRHRYWLFALLLPVAIVLAVFVLASIFLVIAVAIGIYGFDLPLTRTYRFDQDRSPSITATSQGLAGDAYPLDRYTRVRRTRVGGKEISPDSLIVRSKVFRRTADIVESANFVRWERATAVIETRAGKIVVNFWSKNVLEDNSIFAGVVCELPETFLVQFFSLATEGGADVHVAEGLLTSAGRAAAIPCARHEKARRRIPGGPPSLPPFRAEGEAAAWFRSATSVG